MFPNVDFYSGLTLTAIGIPTSMFTVLFAVGRSAGWIAQWKESVEEKGRRISRPRQLYEGPKEKPFIPKLNRDVSTGETWIQPALLRQKSADASRGVVHNAAGGGDTPEYTMYGV